MQTGKLVAKIRLAGVLAILTVAPAVPAGTPVANAISMGSGAQVWNGHSCPAVVPVNVAGLTTGLGGYETKAGWDPARFSSADADVTINITPYLTNGGTRQQSGDSGTPPFTLRAVSSGAVKYGVTSWAPGNPPGNQADGQLATVSLKPTAACGSTALTLTETQLFDIDGNLITPPAAGNGSSVAVFSRYNASGSGVLISSRDVNAVVARLNQAVGAPCRDNYRYDASVGGSSIDGADVSAVVAKLNQSVNAACVQ